MRALPGRLFHWILVCLVPPGHSGDCYCKMLLPQRRRPLQPASVSPPGPLYQGDLQPWLSIGATWELKNTNIQVPPTKDSNLFGLVSSLRMWMLETNPGDSNAQLK